MTLFGKSFFPSRGLSLTPADMPFQSLLQRLPTPTDRHTQMQQQNYQQPSQLQRGAVGYRMKPSSLQQIQLTSTAKPRGHRNGYMQVWQIIRILVCIPLLSVQRHCLPANLYSHHGIISVQRIATTFPRALRLVLLDLRLRSKEPLASKVVRQVYSKRCCQIQNRRIT
jgi:hypothetical protein